MAAFRVSPDGQDRCLIMPSATPPGSSRVVSPLREKRTMRRVKFVSVAGVLGGLVMMASAAVSGETISIKAEKSRLYFAGLYPNYTLFMIGVPVDLDDNWVQKEHYAVLDVKGGPEAGQSVIMKLRKTSDASPQPEWCVTEGGSDFGGHGPTCLTTDDPKSMEQLRFKVMVQYASAADALPADFKDRTWAEYPNLPGRRESEVFGPTELHVIKE